MIILLNITAVNGLGVSSLSRLSQSHCVIVLESTLTGAAGVKASLKVFDQC